MTDEERRALRYAFTFALVSAVATKTIEFIYEEAREVLKRRRDEKRDEKAKVP